MSLKMKRNSSEQNNKYVFCYLKAFKRMNKEYFEFVMLTSLSKMNNPKVGYVLLLLFIKFMHIVKPLNVLCNGTSTSEVPIFKGKTLFHKF